MSGDRAQRLGALAERFSAMEVGFAAENLYLQAASLGLGTTFMAGFNDSAMTRVLAAGERALGVMPVGKPR
jgi:nitroreductase